MGQPATPLTQLDTQRVYLSCDDPNLLQFHRKLLEEWGYSVVSFRSLNDALRSIASLTTASVLVLASSQSKKCSEDEIHDEIRQAALSSAHAVQVVISPQATAPAANEPPELTRKRHVAVTLFRQEVERHLCELATAEEPATPPEQIPLHIRSTVIGNAPWLDEIWQTLFRIQRSTIAVHISGETGTGKELIAHAVHRSSERHGGPWVAINCGALPESLAESLLFGHERGSFTGAHQRQAGYFEAANSGTLFLDEIGELTPSAQVRLLRALETGEVTRVGGQASVPVDVRVVSATNRDLSTMVETNNFRRDLFHRMVGIHIRLPPLRERPHDIPMLVAHLIQKYSGETLRNISGFGLEALQTLKAYQWPGNVRELDNVVRRAMLVTQRSVITPDSLSFHPEQSEVQATASAPSRESQEPGPIPAIKLSSEQETESINRTLQQTQGNLTQAAKLLGISRSTLYRRRKKLKKGKEI